MTEAEARELVEVLLRRDPAVAEEVQKLRAKGLSWEEIGIIANRAADRIARELD